MSRLTESYEDYYRRNYGYSPGLLNVRAGSGGTISGISNMYNSPTIASQLGIADKPKVKNNLKLLLL